MKKVVMGPVHAPAIDPSIAAAMPVVLDPDASAGMQKTGGEKKPKVLVVYGDQLTRMNLRTSLHLRKGYEVVEAATGDEALKLFMEGKGIGIVVMGNELVGRSGIEAGAEMKRKRDARIILTTKDPDLAARLGDRNDVADLVLLEPYDLDGLLLRIEGLQKKKR